MAELNPPQAQAVTHHRGPLLVFAGAGSGKTRVITYRVANLLAEHRVPPYRILAVTFTNKAAGELKARLAELAGPEVARELWVGTFHSVCARLLRRYHAEAGLGERFVIYDESDQKAVMARVLKELDIDERRLAPKLALSWVHRHKREGLLPDDVEPQRSFDRALLEVYAKYQKALATCNAVDFEDLILLVTRIAEDRKSLAGEELRQRFRFVLVDEFQDTNAIQYRLIRALAGNERNLCVVGDDDQSIYRWRGADVELIRGFRKDFADATVIKLEQNYRSTANIVAAALAVIEPSPLREPKKLWTGSDAGDRVHVRAVRDERDEAGFVVSTAKGELARGVSARDIAVFYRVHAQSRVLEEAFRAENLPYQIVGGMKFFERAEVKDLLAYLRLVENPRSDADLMRIVNVPARGIGQKTLQRLLALADVRGTSAYDALPAATESHDFGTAAQKKLGVFRELVENLRDAALVLAPHELAGRVLEDTGYRRLLKQQDNAESDARLENLEELVGSVKEYEQDAHEAGETPTLSGYLERVSLVSAVDAMKDVPSVSLMTVHSAKGLEFTTVFLTGMEDSIFPYRGLEADDVEELDEERRLAYVAITRAKKRLFITHAGMRMLFGQTRYLSPSRFLDDLPPEVVERSGATYPTPRSGSPFLTALNDERAAQGGSQRAARLRPGERIVDHDAFDDLRADEVECAVHPGDRVMHKRFGQGVVERVEIGSAPTIVARFPGYGTKRVLAEYLERA